MGYIAILTKKTGAWFCSSTRALRWKMMDEAPIEWKQDQIWREQRFEKYILDGKSFECTHTCWSGCHGSGRYFGKGVSLFNFSKWLIWRWPVLVPVGSEAYLALVTLITHEPQYTTSSDFKKRPSTGLGVTRRPGPSTSTKGSCKCPKDSIEHWISTNDLWLKAFDCTFQQLGKVDASKDQIKMDSQFHDVFVQAHWRLCHCQQNLTSHRCQPCRMIREIRVKDVINILLGRVPSKLTAVLHHPQKIHRKSWRKNWGLQNHGAQIKKYHPPPSRDGCSPHQDTHVPWWPLQMVLPSFPQHPRLSVRWVP